MLRKLKLSQKNGFLTKKRVSLMMQQLATEFLQDQILKL